MTISAANVAMIAFATSPGNEDGGAHDGLAELHAGHDGEPGNADHVDHDDSADHVEQEQVPEAEAAPALLDQPADHECGRYPRQDEAAGGAQYHAEAAAPAREDGHSDRHQHHEQGKRKAAAPGAEYRAGQHDADVLHDDRRGHEWRLKGRKHGAGRGQRREQRNEGHVSRGHGVSRWLEWSGLGGYSAGCRHESFPAGERACGHRDRGENLQPGRFVQRILGAHPNSRSRYVDGTKHRPFTRAASAFAIRERPPRRRSRAPRSRPTDRRPSSGS